MVPFTVVTDHYSLLWLHRLQNPSGRLARWALRLQPYNFTIVHRKGSEHVVPDCLSRSVPVVELNTLKEIQDKWYTKMKLAVESDPRKYAHWRVDKERLYKLPEKIQQLSDEGDNWKLVVPREERGTLLKQVHDSPCGGHFGVYKTYWKLRCRYYWPQMKSDVVRYVRACTVCAAHKPEQRAPAGYMGRRPAVTKPWQRISLDFIGPLPTSSKGHKYVLVITDDFSKYVHVAPLRTATAKTLCKHLEEEILLVYGVPEFLICDNGTQMKSKEFQKLAQEYGITLSYTPLYYPRADPTERSNKEVKRLIATYIGKTQRSWDKHLCAVACALRTSRSETTGYSPYFVTLEGSLLVMEPNIKLLCRIQE